MSDAFYFKTLYPFQDEALAIIRPIETEFYLTGGTAASRGFLQHRFSDDLDFFVNDDGNFRLWADRIITGLAKRDGWKTEVVLREERYVRLFLVQQEVSLKIEMVNDVPARVGQVLSHPILGRLDSSENILANKISALIDREEPKDLADIWGFSCLLGLSIEQALEGAQGKAAGIFPADVARLLLSAGVEDWEAIRWTEAPDKQRFVDDLHQLGEELLLIS
jgi:hypothetical protein